MTEAGYCRVLLDKKDTKIAELDCQKNRNKFCYSCANATERCFKNEIGCPCDKYKSYKEDLEQKISVLLSCKNCPENKGGYICEKEYENKCLAQKIQYIKELQEEIKNLKKTYRKQRNKRIDDLQKENAELKLKLDALEGQTPWKDIKDKSEVIGQLSTAKELLKWWVSHCGDHDLFCAEKTERFLSEVEK